MQENVIFQELIAALTCCFEPKEFEVQFPNIKSTDTAPVINQGTYPTNWTIDDLVTNNPQFFYKKGLGGVKTLCALVYCSVTDLEITVTREEDTVTGIAAFVGGRPPKGPKGPWL